MRYSFFKLWLLCLFAAQRRRRSSVDERPYDSSSQPKRPRVFFNEEQKDKLRMAYNQDPYPNQSTIEALANELTVGVKTVINWFHNHRMRAKQQQHSGNSSGPGSTSSFNESFNNVIKSEPNDDDGSDASDISSLSGDISAFPVGYTPTDSNQWLFPQFEKVGSKRHGDEDGSDYDDEMCDDEDDRRSDGSLSPVSYVKHSNTDKIGMNNNERKYNGDPEMDISGGELSDDPCLPPNTITSTPSSNFQPGVNVNKRKRSNPQYMSEGRQLDKNKTTSYNTSVSLDEGVEVDADVDIDDVEKENEDNMNTLDLSSKGNKAFDLSARMEKIQKLSNQSEDWEELERTSNIAKLQKNLHQQQSSNSEWEF